MTTEGTTQLALLTENRAKVQALFADRFRRAVDEGDLGRNEDPDELAAFLITVSSGFAIRAADGTSRESLLATARRALAGFPAPLDPSDRTDHRPSHSKEHTHA